MSGHQKCTASKDIISKLLSKSQCIWSFFRGISSPTIKHISKKKNNIYRK